MIKKTTIRKLLYYTRFHVLLSGRKKRLKNSAQSLYHSSKFRNSIVRCILCVIYHFDIAIRYVFAILALCLVAIIVKSQSLNRERIWVTIDRSKEIQLVTRCGHFSCHENANKPRVVELNEIQIARPTRCYFCSSFQFSSMEIRVIKLPTYKPTTFFYPTSKVPSK